MRSPALRWPSHPDIDRNDPSLVLYTPLWKTEMQGSAPVSLDLNKHVCTVTGATWGSQGRTFDGTDDKIVLPETAVNRVQYITMLAWVNCSRVNTNVGQIIARSGVKPHYILTTGVSANKVSLYISTNGLTYETGFPSTASITNGTFAFIAGTYDGTTARIYINGLPDATATTSSGAIDTTNDPVWLGEASDGGGNWFKGIIGEAAIYNRALPANEIWNLYLVTKWRYS